MTKTRKAATTHHQMKPVRCSNLVVKLSVMADTPRKRTASTHDAIYGMGFIGALVYFIQTATGFWVGALGVLKAIFWPVFGVSPVEVFKDVVKKMLEYQLNCWYIPQGSKPRTCFF